MKHKCDCCGHWFDSSELTAIDGVSKLDVSEPKESFRGVVCDICKEDFILSDVESFMPYVLYGIIEGDDTLQEAYEDAKGLYSDWKRPVPTFEEVAETLEKHWAALGERLGSSENRLTIDEMQEFEALHRVFNS